jgi:rhodanese-related sulfurtransferase
MSSVLTSLSPAAAAARLAAGQALLVDIREADEFAREHIAGAVSRPLSGFESAHLKIEPGRDVVFACGSGARTGSNCDRLAAAVEGPAFVLEGGLAGWRAAGLPTDRNAAAPLPILRQVQIAAGSLVLAGAVAGLLVHPAFHGLSAAVGAGLLFSGLSGSCLMASLLSRAPWNRAP